MAPDDVIDLVKTSGPPRPRRRRVPDGRQVVVRPAGHGQAHLRGRELRRVRAGDLQQPRARRARPPPVPRGDGDRRVRGPVPHRRSSTAAASSCGRATILERAIARGVREGRVRRVGARVGVRARRRVAPRRRRVHLRRGDRAALLARGVPRAAPAASAVPRRRGPVRLAHRDQQRRDARDRPAHPDAGSPTGSRRSAPRSRPAPKIFTRLRQGGAARQLRAAAGHARCGRCSRSTPAACSAGAASRRGRRAGPRRRS